MVVRYDETPPAATWNFLEGLAASDARGKADHGRQQQLRKLFNIIGPIRRSHRQDALLSSLRKIVPQFDPPPIGILRLDGDWYESTMICLKKFHVLPGGLILIDDYHPGKDALAPFMTFCPGPEQLSAFLRPHRPRNLH